MNMPLDWSRTAQLLSEPTVLASVKLVASNMGVRPDELDAVLSETRRTAFGALVRAQGGAPPFGADFDEEPEHGRPPQIPDPPLDPIAFVCWIHGIASRKAVRRARPSWVAAWNRGDDAAFADTQPLEWDGVGEVDVDDRGAMVSSAVEVPTEPWGWRGLFRRREVGVAPAAVATLTVLLMLLVIASRGG